MDRLAIWKAHLTPPSIRNVVVMMYNFSGGFVDYITQNIYSVSLTTMDDNGKALHDHQTVGHL